MTKYYNRIDTEGECYSNMPRPKKPNRKERRAKKYGKKQRSSNELNNYRRRQGF